jgi:glycosyltransferase involved in cell wall biosynthesis
MKLALRSGTAPRRRLPAIRAVRRPAPRVTVVIPAYNYGRYLTPCASSALAQRDVDVRVIIADDCSTDDTAAVSQRLAAADPRITVIRNERNLGQLPTMNAALANVDSEYAVKLDADDLLPPGSLARSVTLLEAHPEVSFVYGMPRHFTGEVPAVADKPARDWTVWDGPDWISGRCRSSANVISQPEAVFRTELAREVGWLDVDLPHTFDMCLWLELASLGNVGRINGVTQGLYRVHDASMQRTIHAGLLIDLEGRRDAFQRAFDRYGDRLPDVERLRVTARRNLAVTALDSVCRAYDRGRVAREPVEELTAFALSVYEATTELPEWRGLERRRTVGPRRAPRNPRFFADAVARRISDELRYRNWLRTGEW